MSLRIRIEHGQDAGKTQRLAQPGVYRFGRSPQGSGQILDMKVSKEHFEILISADGAEVRDLGSSHGTTLNGQIVPQVPRPLNPGDELRVGMTVMRLMSDGPADAELKPVGPLPAAGGSPAQASGAHATGGHATGGGGAKPAGESSAALPAAQKGAVGKPVAKALPPDALVGTTLSGYRILEKVGAGGMGSVYRAEQLSLHREVALKVLAEKLVSDSAFVDQFINEARAAGQLNHPNVVQVYDVGQVDGRHFFSMEFIHGGSVEGKIPKTGGGVPWQDALNWFLDGANALIFAEQKGILHRDIKPDNFMVGQEGSVKLCDLGLAKKSESADLLAQGIIGTPHFIAPEAIRRKTDIDQRADLYSLGCTFYRVLTGKNPYPGASVKEILLAHLNAPVPRASALAPDVPKALDEIVAKLMAKDPAARFQTADDLWEALDKVRLEFGLEAHGLHPGRTKKLLYAAVALLVIGAGVVVYLEPWKVKVEKGKDTVTVVDNTDRTALAKAEANRADADFQRIKGDILEKLGKPDQGDAWKHKDEWDKAIASLRAFAKDEKNAPTPAAKLATDHAADLESRWTAYRAKREKLDGATRAAEEALDKATTDAVKASNAKIEAKDWSGAVRDVETGLAAVKEAAARQIDGVVLVAEKKAKDANATLEHQGKLVIDAAKKHVAETLGALKIRLDAATTPEQQEAIEKDLETWLAEHPEDAGEGELAALVAAGRKNAEAMKTTITSVRAAGQRDALLADRYVYFELLHKLFAPGDEIGQGAGAYAGVRFGDAVTKTKGAAVKTDPFKVLVALRAREAELFARLPDVLATNFKARGFKDKLTGNGWSGTPKEFKPDGVVVGDKTHLYADEGPGWFVDLFFEKGLTERWSLAPDEWEGVGAIAEAAGIAEASDSATRFDQALTAFAKAASLDAGRAARLETRKAQIEAEKAAKGKLDESAKLVDETAKAVDRLKGELEKSLSDQGKFDSIKKQILAAEADWRKALETAKNGVTAVVTGAGSTIVRQLLDSKIADDATFGVTIPPAPTGKSGSTPPPAPPVAPPVVPPAVPPVEPPVDAVPGMR